MRRRLTKLALLLIAGAIINVAVAWWCAHESVCVFGKHDFAPKLSKERVNSLLAFSGRSVDGEADGYERNRMGADFEHVTMPDESVDFAFASFGLPLRSLGYE